MGRLTDMIRAQLGRPRAQAGFALLVGTLIGAGASFIAAMVAARTLSLEEFAAFGVGIAVNSLTMQFADLGLGTVAMTEAAEAKDPHEARRQLIALTVRRFGTALAAGALIALAVVFLPSLEPYRDVALIAVFGGAVGCLSFFSAGALQAYRRFREAGAVQVVLGVSRLVLVAVAAAVGLGAPAMMVGYAVLAPVLAMALGATLLAIHSKNEMKSGEADALIAAELKIESEDESERGHGRTSRRRYIAIMAVLGALLLNGDVLLLTTFGSADDVATYSAAWRFAAGVLLLNTAIVGASLPFVMAADDAWAEVKKLARIGVALAVGLLILVLPLTLIGVRVLGDVGKDAAGPLAVLLLAFSIDAYFFYTAQIYLRIRREKYFTVMIATELVSMVLITLVFRNQGAMAPALGQLGTRVIACVMVSAPILLQRGDRISWFKSQIE